ncbi:MULTISPECIES: flagellar protein export ATPase FliI [Vibrio]|jgi:flagellum-specific ATP synthase|uniref:Flagellum-specific ATP synthase n=1 Tax=Vibrio diazotrophicus TaxID=685 RepID=A0A2J8FYL7_VIBDI|nr:MULTISPECIES: flagellar protein export ATPase FliI [Vibrio]MCF7364154.1 flagellar protein export ATPase FliI [Vibrio sp. A1-b2]MCZ4373439.1 flagellar protein export ATPase FliI [Vibrio diazotrophicus]PNH78852.1 flagellar protein export ATPase FliI [Vibrio diazotrophicus]PNH95438.1 flagellar protein export ATPase FliI [Vibrio diazotrophicus]PNI02109.1 flagellar protein export ATPase FliI [Vibrio diazotrophicus]
MSNNVRTHSFLSERLNDAIASLDAIPVARVTGRLVKVNGLMLQAVGCRFKLEQRCMVETAEGSMIEAQVVGFDHNVAYLMPIRRLGGLFAGAKVVPLEGDSTVQMSNQWLGRVVNGLGEALDGGPELRGGERISLEANPINPLKRRPVDTPLDVGVKTINGLLTVGKGQRIGLMAGSGVGKSVLLGMISQNTQADVIVVGLIGERGREVREFIERNLTEEARQKAIIIAAPADESPLMRLRATLLCHRAAEYFRDKGKDVLLMMDSLTRYAMAQREISLSLGEPPASRGYPPSVFSVLPQLLERAGNSENQEGSLTAIYTVLAEGDDQQDPVVDSARAILDGHVVLSRQLAEQGHYPAIDVNASISRCMSSCTQEAHQTVANQFRQLYSNYLQVKELLPLGGYQPGQDPDLDRAVAMYPSLSAYLQQSAHESVSYEESLTQLATLFQGR